MRKNTIMTMFLLLGLSMALTACGIKPAHVDPPPGAEDSGFPHSYPDLRNDPRPPALPR